MEPSQKHKNTYPLFFPALVILVLSLMLFFLLDKGISWVPFIGLMILSLRVWWVYKQHRRGNSEPLERIILASKILLITLPLLALLTYVLKQLHII
jgi:type VI protein secretion system component VasK